MTEPRLFEILSICTGGGYRYCRTKPKHPKANTKGLYPLHRVLMENELGRLLKTGEVVHHKDGDTTNDELDNLELTETSEHSRHHGLERGEMIDIVCVICSKRFQLPRYRYKLRMKRSKSGGLACSRACGYVMGGRTTRGIRH